MKTITESKLIGKWYQIAKTYNHREMKFMEIFLYLSNSKAKSLDGLYVAVEQKGNKTKRRLSLKLLSRKKCNCLIIKGLFFYKIYKVLEFNDDDSVLIISDLRQKYVVIYSKKPTLEHNIVELYLNSISSKLNNEKIKLYSNSIIEKNS